MSWSLILVWCGAQIELSTSSESIRGRWGLQATIFQPGNFKRGNPMGTPATMAYAADGWQTHSEKSHKKLRCHKGSGHKWM